LNAYSIAPTVPLFSGIRTALGRENANYQKRKARILVVDDDPGLLRLLTIRLRAENYEVEAVESAAAALAACGRFRPDLVITDLRMDQMDGIGLLKELQGRWPGLRVIILTAHGTIPDAVYATQSGAFGFLTKPVDKQELLDQVQKALKISGFSQQDEDWRSEIITRSSLMEDKLAQANMVAGTDARVLLTGESGTGKELLARAIHKASPRRNKPFVAINCSAMAENLLESELFGHEKGAFTGAIRTHKGLFQAAEGGSLLLDEIGDMPMRLQIKLLRVLQENQIRPVGSAEAIPTNVRVISATHRDLQQLMVGGQFREDLYYRLNVVHIEMPGLGKRREDIPLLVAHFLEQIAKESGQRKIYAPESVEMLATAEWPGNIRQLYNVVRQNVALSRGPIITAELVQQSLGGGSNKLASFDEARDEFTRNYLSQILQITGGNVSQAARLAKRNRTDFYKLLSRHQLVPDDFKKS
jgi:two-component system, NtrC family, response regulator GlrR